MNLKKHFKKIDDEFPDMKPIIKNVKAVSVETKSIAESLVMLTAWANGEGYDITISSKGDDVKHIELHSDELEAILRGLIELNYFD